MIRLVTYLRFLDIAGRKASDKLGVKCFYNGIDGEMSLKERVAMIGKHLFGQVKHYRRNSFSHTHKTDMGTMDDDARDVASMDRIVQNACITYRSN